MSNLCDNNVVVKGPPGELRRLANMIGPYFDFDTIIPMPKELELPGANGDFKYPPHYAGSTCADLVEDPKNQEQADRVKELLTKHGANAWYHWRCENWGTTWQPHFVCFETSAGDLTIRFRTAWSFPEPIFRKLAEMFPSLHFSGYAVEHGNAWTLNFEAANGDLTVVFLDYRKTYPKGLFTKRRREKRGRPREPLPF